MTPINHMVVQVTPINHTVWCATVMLPLPLVVLLFMRAFAESLIHINILVTGVNHVFVMVSLHLETPSKKVINL